MEVHPGVGFEHAPASERVRVADAALYGDQLGQGCSNRLVVKPEGAEQEIARLRPSGDLTDGTLCEHTVGIGVAGDQEITRLVVVRISMHTPEGRIVHHVDMLGRFRRAAGHPAW